MKRLKKFTNLNEIKDKSFRYYITFKKTNKLLTKCFKKSILDNLLEINLNFYLIKLF